MKAPERHGGEGIRIQASWSPEGIRCRLVIEDAETLVAVELIREEWVSLRDMIDKVIARMDAETEEAPR